MSALDQERLTALVMLGIKDKNTFPLILSPTRPYERLSTCQGTQG